MKEQKLGLTAPEVDMIFKFFDEDGSGTITYDEFLFGVRGEMNERREQMALLAFDVIDKDKSGILDIDDITEAYDTSKHPDVLAGKKTKGAVLREFLDTFDQGDKDGKVYPNEWKRYYANISASIDDDDYFELMIRNAWHIPGGEGWCANTANKRVLVIDPETGEESIQCIENDLGMDVNDPEAIKARLAQNKKKGKGAGGNVGVQKNPNATAKLGGSSMDFGGYDKDSKPATTVKKKKATRMGESSLAITGDKLGYGPVEDLTEEEEAMGWGKDMPESTKTLLKRLKMNLKRRGADGIAGLARKFRIIDDDGSGTLEMSEFTKCMKEMKTNFTEEENEELFKFFDEDGAGHITFKEFAKAVSTPYSPGLNKVLETDVSAPMSDAAIDKYVQNVHLVASSRPP